MTEFQDSLNNKQGLVGETLATLQFKVQPSIIYFLFILPHQQYKSPLSFITYGYFSINESINQLINYYMLLLVGMLLAWMIPISDENLAKLTCTWWLSLLSWGSFISILLSLLQLELLALDCSSPWPDCTTPGGGCHLCPLMVTFKYLINEMVTLNVAPCTTLHERID